jgi:hypothetical protein
MKTTALVVTILATSLVAVLLSGLALGRNGRTRAEQRDAELSPRLLSPQISWETETKYVMQWDERCRMLLFDGLLAAPRFRRCAGYHMTVTDVSYSPPSAPDDHSLDAGTVGKLVDLSESNKSDGRLHYHVQWDDSKKCCVFEELEAPRTAEVFQFFVDGGKLSSGRVYNSFNAPLDLLDTYRSYRR